MAKEEGVKLFEDLGGLQVPVGTIKDQEAFLAGRSWFKSQCYCILRMQPSASLCLPICKIGLKFAALQQESVLRIAA